jgi:hypothetical protein
MKNTTKQISKFLLRIILLPRLIKDKFFNNKKANNRNTNKINVNNNSANKKQINNDRNKYGFPSYDEVKKLLK